MLLFILGCKKFLDIKPVGAQFLTDITTVKNTMGSWMYNFSKNGRWTIMEDAPEPWAPIQFSSDNSFTSAIDVWAFTNWDQSSNTLTPAQKRVIDRGTIRSDWTVYYNLIGLMNLIITEGNLATGDLQTKDIVVGEALIQRSYYFLKLLQYYAPLDNPQLGIPVYTGIHNSLDEADLSRKPQQAVFDQIISDLNEAELRIKRTPSSKTFNIMYNIDCINRVAAQIYYWKAQTLVADESDWQKAQEYSQKACAIPNTNQTVYPYSIEKLNQEIFNLTYSSTSAGLINNGYPEAYKIAANSSTFLNNTFSYDINIWNQLYKDGDKRKKLWFLDTPNYNKPADQITINDLSPTRKMKGNIRFFLFRLAEQWLINIEANAHTGNIAKAQSMLKEWRELRYEPSVISSLPVPNTVKEFEDELYLERKREFLGESDILWLDMKRRRVSETRTVQSFTATLQSDDFRYQFSIPQSEIDYNPQIIVNPGWVELYY